MLDLDDIDALTLSNYYAPAVPIHKHSRVSSSGPKEHSQAIKNGLQQRKNGRHIAFPWPRMLDMCEKAPKLGDPYYF